MGRITRSQAVSEPEEEPAPKVTKAKKKTTTAKPAGVAAKPVRAKPGPKPKAGKQAAATSSEGTMSATEQQELKRLLKKVKAGEAKQSEDRGIGKSSTVL